MSLAAEDSYMSHNTVVVSCGWNRWLGGRQNMPRRVQGGWQLVGQDEGYEPFLPTLPPITLLTGNLTRIFIDDLHRRKAHHNKKTAKTKSKIKKESLS
jgi:hypothetical protein